MPQPAPITVMIVDDHAVVRAGLLLDLAGVFLMVGIVWGIAALV